MAWDYAELSKAAKEAGGPEKLTELITEAGKQEGRSEMMPVVGVALGVGVLSTLGISELVKFFKRKKISPEEVEANKAEIIQGIKDYDATHPEELRATDSCERPMSNQDEDETEVTEKLKEDK